MESTTDGKVPSVAKTECISEDGGLRSCAEALTETRFFRTNFQSLR